MVLLVFCFYLVFRTCVYQSRIIKTDSDKVIYFGRSCIYKNESLASSTGVDSSAQPEPVPRFAHQLVYDYIRKVSQLIEDFSQKENGENMFTFVSLVK